MDSDIIREFYRFPFVITPCLPIGTVQDLDGSKLLILRFTAVCTRKRFSKCITFAVLISSFRYVLGKLIKSYFVIVRKSIQDRYEYSR